ncbi:MAG TPA: YcnI family protein [Jatrophihabitans sp.]|jgi:uncharacterized protein|uniref:YcnI family copper-binding membrane protein n=1 Tax=Jatrophihabitans sp. TaxID=1932789 RepID=UPI002E03FB56|nr:YcnI family protein [Jatrophihabitans sp.]
MTRLRTLTVGIATTLVALFVLAGSAFAHITITAPGAERGGSDQEITFRVPVEEQHKTVGLTVQLPTDHPIASVLVAPVPGWTHTQTTTKLATPIKTDDGEITEAVSEIAWTANSGQGIAPGEFGAFTIIAGLLPDVPTLTFKALQKYDDGSVVSWIETAAPGSTVAPEHPAPELTLSAAATTASASAKPAATAPSGGSSSTGPVVLAVVALVVAAAALGLAVVSRARRS